MLSTILVALDSSDISEQVVQSLHNLQLQPKARVVLSHVIPPAGSELDLEADRPQVDVEDSQYRFAEKQLQTYQTHLPYATELEIVTGDPAEEIIRLANIYKVDLIVLGNRGLTGMKRILQGSVSSQVMEDAPCSVLVVKPR